MKKIKKYITFLIIIIIPIITEGNSSENKILLKINNEIVTTVDILKEINYLSIINNNFNNANDNQKVEIARNSLVKEKIKVIELLKHHKEIQINEEILENIIKNYFARLKITSISDFENYFNKKNIDTNFIKHKIAIEVLWNQLIYSKFYKSVKIDEEEIKNDILNKKKQKEYLLSEIVFETEINQKLDEKYKLIKEIIDKKFSQAVLMYSVSDSSKNDGKLNWIKENALNKTIRDKLSGINIGEITEPIVIPGGFLILKIEDIKEVERKINLDQETKMIIEKKTNDQLTRFSNIYFNKIKKDITINEI